MSATRVHSYNKNEKKLRRLRIVKDLLLRVIAVYQRSAQIQTIVSPVPTPRPARNQGPSTELAYSDVQSASEYEAAQEALGHYGATSNQHVIIIQDPRAVQETLRSLAATTRLGPRVRRE
ncbi:hypothetical protein NDU88_004136 [Pleurodeles waltl]|uniref:Uncharacterized protein n=1 Tax=Pleurodeles waltl TaxID=8319 RepID=A0AAV7QDP3_PLEWA|nr:hypothetical protein NDU88_004136 [Pleurodeles waltl]